MNQHVNDYETEGKRLWELLYALAHAEEQEGVKKEKTNEILSVVKKKVDAYHYVDQKFKGEETRLKDIIESFQSTLKSVQNQKDRFKKRIKWMLEYDGTDELRGNLSKISLRRTKPVVKVTLDADSHTAILYRDYITVKRSHHWDKEKLRQDVGDNKALQKICYLQENKSVNITTIKKSKR